jgi:phosphoribosyl 1,2-cyclic phosphate phosphodiesterase
MEVIFLGTGTSQGVPMIAHPQGGCDLSDTRNWRTRCSIHVTMGGQHIQVDAAPELRLQCIHNNISQVDVFILTHGHADHILGMDDLRRFCDQNDGTALTVYSSSEGLTRVRAIFPYAITEKPAIKGYPAFNLKLVESAIELEGGTIHTTFLPHDPIEVIGLVFEEKNSGQRFAYYTDCKAVPAAARELARDVDLLVLDALRPSPHRAHMTVDEAVQTATEMQAPITYLTHMTYQVDHANTESRLPANVRLAYDGLRVDIAALHKSK